MTLSASWVFHTVLSFNMILMHFITGHCILSQNWILSNCFMSLLHPHPIHLWYLSYIYTYPERYWNNNFQWFKLDKHYEYIISQAYKVFAIIRHTFNKYQYPSVKVKLYIILIPSQLYLFISVMHGVLIWWKTLLVLNDYCVKPQSISWMTIVLITSLEWSNYNSYL